MGAAQRQPRSEKVRAKLRAINAQTPPKTEEHQIPESKHRQQHQQPTEICKTSIPGSNPGGAFNFPVQIRSFVRRVHKPPAADGPKWPQHRAVSPGVEPVSD
jgi:hypothetical protein